ncbi:predicted protein [Nematostella vectensis]|uniref:Coiled-coil domain-containing protein 14 n=1 Tax=Nematostella vectensis TaxID=45351 RepID=A7S1D7_NEMVE|nr:predicted protein [Nematostella vectensis]|eukprot:XP_001634503.1 predicted protein [Nematostella vectensis]
MQMKNICNAGKHIHRPTQYRVRASVVGHGLDRCAALLTNILDNDDKGKDQWSKKARHIKTAVKARQGVGRQSNARAVVIPTAQINQQDSPSPGQDPSHQSLPPRSAHATIYNDRLVASTPLLTADERERQQALLNRVEGSLRNNRDNWSNTITCSRYGLRKSNRDNWSNTITCSRYGLRKSNRDNWSNTITYSRYSLRKSNRDNWSNTITYSRYGLRKSNRDNWSNTIPYSRYAYRKSKRDNWSNTTTYSRYTYRKSNRDNWSNTITYSRYDLRKSNRDNWSNTTTCSRYSLRKSNRDNWSNTTTYSRYDLRKSNRDNWSNTITCSRYGLRKSNRDNWSNTITYSRYGLRKSNRDNWSNTITYSRYDLRKSNRDNWSNTTTCSRYSLRKSNRDNWSNTITYSRKRYRTSSRNNCSNTIPYSRKSKRDNSLQNQRSPEVQEDQKRLLQNSMLHELEDFQQTMPESPKVNVSVHRDAHSSSGSTKARRSLDFPSSLGSLLETSRPRKPTSHGRHSIPKTSTDDHSYGRSATKNLSPEHEVPYELSNAQDTNKKVRIVSPTLPHSDKSSSHTPRDWSESRVQAESPVQKHGLQSSLPGSVKPRSQSLIKGATRPRYGGSSVDHTPERSPVRSAGSAGRSLSRGAGGDAQTLLYLVSELREVIGNSDDIEVQRLLMEIENTSSLLPYLYASSASPRHPSSANDEVQSLRIDNAQLRRNLRMANEKLQEQREIQQSLEELKSGHTNVSFEQQGKYHLPLYLCIVNMILHTELEFTKGRRNAQLEASRLSVEVRQLKSELEASKLSSEAAEKENVILTLSLKQKDKEIERLGEMTRGLQQSMRRVLLDIDEYHPGSVVKDHLLKQPRVMEHMGITLGTETSQQYSLSPLANIPAVHDAAKATPRDEREFRTQSTARHQQSSLDGSLHRSTLENSIQLKSNSARKTTHRDLIPKISNTPKLAWSPGKDSNTILTRESALPLSSRGGWVRDNRRTPNSPRFTWTSPDKPLEGPGLLNTLAVLGMNSPSSRPGANDTSADLSSLSSQDEQEFQRDLASLDADIARIQRSLRQAALKTEHDDGKHSP